MLSPAQLQALKADILADPFLNVQPNSADGNTAIAAAYGLVVAPTFWVWRTAVSRAEIYNLTSPDNTNWNWTFYKNQSQTEQNAWVQMFMGDAADFSKLNLRSGITVIFTSASSANATHALAIGRRAANRAEKLFATGTGSSASPAVMTFEGALTPGDIDQARNLP